MASTQRQTDSRLRTVKAKNTTELDDFFELVRRIERIAKYQALERDEKFNELGDDGVPKKESLRFKGNNSLSFPGSPVESLRAYFEDLEESYSTTQIRHSKEQDSTRLVRVHTEESGKKKYQGSNKRLELDRYDVIVNFMGLAGASGVLPQHYTRLIMERNRKRDTNLADFLDLFNHRLISLFYRSWTKYRFSYQYEAYLGKRENDPFTGVVQSLSGQHQNQGHEAQLYYSGHFSRKNKSATNLESMLSDFLEKSVKVKTFVGQWLLIQDADRAVIGSEGFGRNNRLGHGVLLGRRSWSMQSKISVHIDAMSYSEYQELISKSGKFLQLKKLISSYVPIHLSVDLIFSVFDRRENDRQLGRGLKLNQNLWLGGKASKNLLGKIALVRNIQ
ncbi:type VI secretion system baseplate subunit TssG [Aurantivibrio infirmus]